MVGRPNVGKSSLINAITGENRVMVKDMSGTTRDSIDTKFKFDGTDFVLIDTA
jgi:GTP-binding protein